MNLIPNQFADHKTTVQKIGLVVLGIFILGCSVKTVLRVPAWKDTLSLNRAAIQVSKNSARANQYMGYTLYRMGLEEPDVGKKQTLFNEAKGYVDRALEIYPSYTDALTAKGGLLAADFQKTGDLDTLLKGFYNILAANPVPFVDTYLDYLHARVDTYTLADFYYRVGYELFGQQKYNNKMAQKYIEKGLALAPSHQGLLQAKNSLSH